MNGRWRRRVAATLLGVVMLLGIVVSGPAWLPIPARFLAVSDLPARADAIVVLSGRASERAPLAADLHRRGVASVIITLGEHVDPLSRALGKPLTEAELNARVVARNGVPPAAIVVVSSGRSTWEEARALGKHFASAPVQTVVLVTSGFGARRVRWTFARVLGDRPSIVVVSPETPEIGPHNWWRSERGVVEVVTESMKLLYLAVRLALSSSWGRQ
ncbi:MAG: hypothetical protein A3I00_05405 [Betaproteobacteria bacterium RIFCSPLOWO2_02_FULL_64_12]|nr:MAG: hypothetical protein A3I00_05405 [Betaproteobacteria bacterium RIFCSPLOWO2_02_FULL_64_12]